MSQANEQRLPLGWTTAQLSDVAMVVMGQSPPSSTYNKSGTGLPFLQGKADFGAIYPRVRVWCVRPNKIADADDILLSVRAPVGPTNLAPVQCCIGRGLAAVRPEAGLTLKYLLHAFRRFADDLDAKGTGTTFKAVSGKVVREFSIPIPPQAEQNRIANALDELFSDLDAGVAALERVRHKLKLYRASVLKAAVEGALTADWREEHPDAEPAGELLKRILVERRRWEEDQLRKFAEKGKTPPRNWKAKYKEPFAPETADLPQLPEGWCWATFAALADQRLGKMLDKSKNSGPLRPYLRNLNTRWFGFDLNDLAEMHIRDEEFPNVSVRFGDLVVCEGGEPGRCAVWSRENETIAIQKALHRVRPSLGVSSHYLSFVLAADAHSGRLQKAFTGTGINHLTGESLGSYSVPLPSSREQQQIVEAVEEQLAIIDHLEADLDAKLKTAQGLRQGILRHAFTGKLVPQDPSDEPASELLKRIAAEREARAREAAAKRAGRNATGGQTSRRHRARLRKEKVD